LEILENDVQVDIGELTFAEFLDEGGLGSILEELTLLERTFFSKAKMAAERARRGDALDDGAGLGGRGPRA